MILIFKLVLLNFRRRVMIWLCYKFADIYNICALTVLDIVKPVCHIKITGERVADHFGRNNKEGDYNAILL